MLMLQLLTINTCRMNTWKEPKEEKTEKGREEEVREGKTVPDVAE